MKTTHRLVFHRPTIILNFTPKPRSMVRVRTDHLFLFLSLNR